MCESGVSARPLSPIIPWNLPLAFSLPALVRELFPVFMSWKLASAFIYTEPLRFSSCINWRKVARTIVRAAKTVPEMSLIFNCSMNLCISLWAHWKEQGRKRGLERPQKKRFHVMQRREGSTWFLNLKFCPNSSPQRKAPVHIPCSHGLFSMILKMQGCFNSEKKISKSVKCYDNAPSCILWSSQYSTDKIFWWLSVL